MRRIHRVSRAGSIRNKEGILGEGDGRKGQSGPISRVLSWAIIYLACTSPCSSTHATRTRTGPAHGAPICACSGWGLPSRHVATTLVVSYTTVSAFLSPARGGQRESSFLRHFPSGRPAWPLASILPCGARTFLTCEHAARAIAWPALRRVLYHEAERVGSWRRRGSRRFASIPS